MKESMQLLHGKYNNQKFKSENKEQKKEFTIYLPMGMKKNVENSQLQRRGQWTKGKRIGELGKKKKNRFQCIILYVSLCSCG